MISRPVGDFQRRPLFSRPEEPEGETGGDSSESKQALNTSINPQPTKVTRASVATNHHLLVTVATGQTGNMANDKTIRRIGGGAKRTLVFTERCCFTGINAASSKSFGTIAMVPYAQRERGERGRKRERIISLVN